MKTVTIQIGNSDDKLTQNDWVNYVESVKVLTENYSSGVHFFGGPPTWWHWQNVAWVIEGEDEKLQLLKNDLWAIRKKYGQDSIAWTEGETQFL